MAPALKGGHRRKIVVGGTHVQFLAWLRENNLPPSSAVFADDYHRIAGLELKPEDIVRLGPVPFELEQYIQTRIR